MIFVRQLLLNLSLLLVILFFFQLWHERKGTPITKKSLNVYFSLSLLTCYALPTLVTNDVIFNLRQIPLTLAGLYLGFGSAAWLFILTIFLRMLVGIDLGFWITLVNFAALTLLTSSLHRWFCMQNMTKKLVTAALLSTFATISWISVHLHTNHSIDLYFWIGFIFIPILGIFIVTYTIDSVSRNFSVREKLFLSEKLETISQLSASISHEVRNPHAAIRGFLQLLKEPSFSAEKREEFLQIAISELDRAEKIITDYLTFAKPHNEEMNIINISDVLKNILAIMSPLANMNNVDIKTRFSDYMFIRADKNKLHQAILNITKNSIEALENGGTLTINSEIYENHIHLWICDNGIGMTKEQVDRLGQPYFTTKGSRGTGLGMMVTFSIIKAMKGKLSVESEVGKGTTFKLTFPLSD